MVFVDIQFGFQDYNCVVSEEADLQVLNTAELSSWFAKLQNQDTEAVQYDADGPFFTHPEASCLQIDLRAALESFRAYRRTLLSVDVDL